MKTAFAPRIAVALAVALGSASLADVRLPAFFDDGMVLQRDAEARVWGWADPGERVTVTPDWPGAGSASATADEHGRWMVRLATPGAGGPHTIAVRGANEVTISDVLVGEVWLCSGQSNMEMPLGNIGPGYTGVLDWEAEVAAAHHPAIRLFTVANTIAAKPEDDCRGAWTACTPETARTFSATAYYVGRELHRQLGVPIGLIAADWGGTVCEAWMSERAVARFAELADRLDVVRLTRDDPDRLEREHTEAVAAWEKSMASDERALWARSDFDDSAWPTHPVPATWAGPDLGGFDGTAWFRTTIDVPREWAGRDLLLSLGPIDDQDWTFFNGEKVGEMTGPGRWNQPRRYTAPGRLVAAGRNTIAVAVLDTGGLGGINGSPEDLWARPADAEGAEPLRLAGDWRYRRAADGSPPPRPEPRRIGPNSPTALHNGMIAPLAPMAVRGVIWYQGESNRGRAWQYRMLFPALIEDWRAVFQNPEMPFYFVQIAPFDYPNDRGETAELREAQLLATRTPNTGMVVTMDVGETKDIHPRNKREVGRRLALWALAKTYGAEGVECSGPLFTGASPEDGMIRTRFAHADGLSARGGLPRGFEVAGQDRVYHPAGAIVDGTSVLVFSPLVPEPVAVRYGWGAAVEPNLFNGAGLPASPFRSDEWERVTQPK
ncbi:MAG: beta galactosidase jelly roll domain-containing protein [Phycisphaeraceae bacterium]|nr:beta galactosidase jelly roll domain-containing protein [Phycisphaeraceae bacterium]